MTNLWFILYYLGDDIIFFLLFQPPKYEPTTYVYGDHRLHGILLSFSIAGHSFVAHEILICLCFKYQQLQYFCLKYLTSSYSFPACYELCNYI